MYLIFLFVFIMRILTRVVSFIMRAICIFERARTEYLRCAGFSQHTLLNEQQLAFVVKTMNIDYRYPAKLDNLLIVETLVTELKGASIFFTQRLKKEEQIYARLQ